MRGEGNVYSDIDLVVVCPNLPSAWRDSFEMEDFPVEAFVQDPETLRYFMDMDMQSGCPIMVNMVATSTIIGRDGVAAKAIQEEAQRLLARGPKPLSGPAYDRMRYIISDIADDLRAHRPTAEVAGACGHALSADRRSDAARKGNMVGPRKMGAPNARQIR
jgi:hypothetical protein